MSQFIASSQPSPYPTLQSQQQKTSAASVQRPHTTNMKPDLFFGQASCCSHSSATSPQLTTLQRIGNIFAYIFDRIATPFLWIRNQLLTTPSTERDWTCSFWELGFKKSKKDAVWELLEQPNRLEAHIDNKKIKVDEPRDSQNRTLLMQAASHGYTDSVNILIARGANVAHQDKSKRTALMEACLDGYTSTVNALIEALKDKPTEQKLLINHQDDMKHTALMYATIWGNLSTVQALVDAGADKALTNDDGKTALGMAKESLKNHPEWKKTFDEIIKILEKQ